VGVVLVVALVIVGSTVVVVFGDRALRDTERQSDVERAQQAMTLFDSQTAQVALSESDRQTVRFGRTSGTYRVEPDAGEISIVNVDRDDDEDNITWTADGYPTDAVDGDGDGDIEYIHNETLGAVVYESGDRTVAYQGGGVWQKGPGDGTRMISPPEFHYRAQTLTLPIVQVTGGGAASGSTRATVSKGAFRARPVYPNASDNFDLAGKEPFRNPVENGSVVVRIESEYAEAWGSYFEERTDGDVVYPADGVVTVELVSLAEVGEFDMPLEGGALGVSGAPDRHSIERPSAGETAFSIRLRPDDADSADFANLQWSLYADEGNHEFEMHLKKAGSGDGCASGTVGETGVEAHLTIYYSWNDGEDYHGWKTTDPIEAECDDLNGDGDDEIYLDAVFVDDKDDDGVYDDNEADEGDHQLEFQKLSSSDLESFNPNGDLDGSYPLDGHTAEGEPVTPTTGSPGTIRAADQLVNHYFAELPEEFDLTVDDKGSDTVSEDISEVAFYSSGSGRGVTYLHVTSSQVEVEVDAG
jgi:type II secretory pathway pseudopilin PulG